MKIQNTLIILTLISVASYSSYKQMNQRIPYQNFSLLPEGAHQAKNKAQRSIASQTRQVRPDSSRLAPIRTPTPVPTPIFSPDNPVKPRVSSVQANDPAFLNILNFFNVNKIVQPSIPEALCNDGSAPGYHLKRGFGAGANRWIIWLEGGGGCGSDDPNNPLWCGLRKNHYSETGTTLPSVMFDLQGILSKSDLYNADFYSYNQVMVHYCSSDFWAGKGVQKVINAATGEKFWFSGRKIIEALVLDLKQKYGMNNATNVILTGSSAGGSGISTNADEIKTSLPAADVVTIIDATNLFKFENYFSGLLPADEVEHSIGPNSFQEIYSFLPMEGNRNCIAALRSSCGPNDRCASNAYTCMLPGNAAGYIKMPVFMASDQLDNKLLEAYGFSFCQTNNPTEYNPWLNLFIAESNNKAKTVSGYFLSRTGDHGLVPTHHWSTPINDNGTNYYLKSVFGAWYFNRSTSVKRYIQSPSSTLQPHQESSPAYCTP